MSSAWKDWHLRKKGSVEPEVGQLVKLLNQTTSKRILDVGCGAGRHTVYFARKGFEVYAFDKDRESLQTAKQLLKDENLKADLRLLDMKNPLPYQTSFFDAAIGVRVIHHTYVSNIFNLVREIDRVLKPSGYLFIQVPSYESETFDSGTIWAEPCTLIARDGPERGVPHHFFKKDELLQIFLDYVVKDIHSVSDHYGGYCLIAQKQKA